MTEVGRPAFEERAADWLPVNEAQRRVLGQSRLLHTELVPLAEAYGRALAEDVHAEATLPPWDNAAMDGYAVYSPDVKGASPDAPAVLAVRNSIRAGGARAGPLERGEALRIMTGAPIPPGADSVIRVEDTDRESVSGRVRIFNQRDIRANVRPGGQDFRPGDAVLASGQAVHPGTVGVLAALGRTRVLVRSRPLVAILTTGDELRGPGRYEDVRAGAGVPESNGPMLAAAVAAAGGVPLVLGPVPDDGDALRRAVAAAAGAHVLATVGGASMGEADLVKRVLDEAGFRQDFWRVAMRPGSPFSFGSLPRGELSQPVFGLPGNPSSAFVTFEIFVRPFLLSMAGHAQIHRRRMTCVAGEEFRGGKRTHFTRVKLETLESVTVALPSGPQGSGLVGGLPSAQGLAMLSAGSVVPAGGSLDVILLDPGPGASAGSPLEAMEG